MAGLSGFTFIRNALKYDFPIREAAESMLPLIDELVINVGRSEDGTESFIEELIAGWRKTYPQVEYKTVHSVWDDTKTDSGLVLSEQTNIALDACSNDWALYLQGDEALHEEDHGTISKALAAASEDPACEGLRLKYLHFYGGYTLIQQPWNWYPSEIRLVRRSAGARSFGDAQTFRRADGGKLNTLLIDAHVYHYGHARHPDTMKQKIAYFHRFWHGDNHGIKVGKAYNLDLKSLVWFWGTHPAPYARRVGEGMAWSPKPVLHDGPKPVVYILNNSSHERQFARELQEELGVVGYRSQIVNNVGEAKRHARRGKIKDRVLVDLDASGACIFKAATRGLLGAGSFSPRIAHAPEGALGKTVRRLYTHVNWGRHENTAEGFAVPASLYGRQIVKLIDSA